MMESNRTPSDGFGWPENASAAARAPQESAEETFLKMQQQQHQQQQHQQQQQQLAGMQQGNLDQSAFSQQWPQVQSSTVLGAAATGTGQLNNMSSQLNFPGLPLYSSVSPAFSQMIPGMQVQSFTGQQQANATAFGMNQPGALSSMMGGAQNSTVGSTLPPSDVPGFNNFPAFSDMGAATADSLQQRYQKLMLQQLLLQQAQQESPLLQQSLAGGQGFLGGGDFSSLASTLGGGNMLSFMNQNLSFLPTGGADANANAGFNGLATTSGMNGLATASGMNGLATASGMNGLATASGMNGLAAAADNSNMDPSSALGMANMPPTGPTPHLATTAKGRRKTAKNKRDKNRPKQPLSAYNIFFKDQRAKMLAELQNAPPPAEPSDGQSNASNDDANGNTKDDTSSRKRPREPPHGKIGFETMAKTIAKKWKEIEKEALSKYESMAQDDQKRYKAELAVYLQKKRDETNTEKGGNRASANDAEKE
jgi:hypothetical protein